MTVRELREAIQHAPPDQPVMVAGYGALMLVTGAFSDSKGQVTVLYVADPELPFEEAPSV